ncbi:MAG TPA: hypothetical protein VF622_07500 [Segetibacter sp.]|jgi:hypothetical protein
MKKLPMIFSLVAFVACTDSNTNTNTVDSIANVIDSAADAKIDSVQKRADSIANVIDSAADATIDTLINK